MNYADKIKSALTAEEVILLYTGKRPNRAGKILCPFHAEKTPSLKIFEGQKGWHCYGCGAGQDVIDFVRMLFGLDFNKACEKLNDDFNLGLPIGKPLSREERLKAEREANELRRKAEAKKKAHERLISAYDLAVGWWAALDIIKRTKAPKSPFDSLDEGYAHACKNIDAAWYALEEAADRLYYFEKGIDYNFVQKA